MIQVTDMPEADDPRIQLRNAGRLARSQLSPHDRQQASAIVVARLAALPEVRRARRVLVTAAIGDEIDLSAFHAAVRATGGIIALPVTRGLDLVVVDHAHGGILVAGWGGVHEPTGPPAAGPVDVVIAPALAVDRRGGRLGYGGGHFDRFLAGPACDAAVIGAVFACQLVDELPLQAHDVRLHVVVTEAGTHRTGALRARG
jgi:5-formyltetrahydrofolate cyclo-ligase